MSAIGHKGSPVDEETEFWPRFQTVIEANTYVTVLHKVVPFTWYCIRMLGFTRKGEGTESSCIFELTEQGGKIKL